MEKISGKVKNGMGIGKTIDFPTINLSYSGEMRGVFVGKVLLKTNSEDFEKAAVHLGNRPTFFDEEVLCEAYLIDWKEEIQVGTEVRIEVFDKIRDVKKFKNLMSLKHQIVQDIEFVRNWYNLK